MGGQACANGRRGRPGLAHRIRFYTAACAWYISLPSHFFPFSDNVPWDPRSQGLPPLLVGHLTRPSGLVRDRISRVNPSASASCCLGDPVSSPSLRKLVTRATWAGCISNTETPMTTTTKRHWGIPRNPGTYVLEYKVWDGGPVQEHQGPTPFAELLHENSLLSRQADPQP